MRHLAQRPPHDRVHLGLTLAHLASQIVGAGNRARIVTMNPQLVQTLAQPYEVLHQSKEACSVGVVLSVI